MADYVGAIDQGTTSTRFMIFDHSGNEVARHQLEHEQILPQSGWVEHNPVEIWENTGKVIQEGPEEGGPLPQRPRGSGHHQPA
jgi:glycerol kinase